MNIRDVRDMAKQLGIRTGKMKKDDLIRTIQRTEGNFDCFGTAFSGECTQSECLWRSDCLAPVR